MKKWIPRILAVIIMIPIVLIGVGLSIIWNTYLISDSIITGIKRRAFIRKKRKSKETY
jgi:cell division protein FtsX